MSLPKLLCFGIGVSKAILDIAAISVIEQFAVSNDVDSFEKVVISSH